MQKRLAAPVASRKEGNKRRVDGLLSERDRLMSEIALRARLGSLPPMLAKARTILTRFWGKASWDARSELLTVARMLLALGAAQPALMAQRGIPPARPSGDTPNHRRRNAVRASRKVVEVT